MELLNQIMQINRPEQTDAPDPTATDIIAPDILAYAEDEVIQDDSFSYDGYQVVRGEFFAHVYEPSISFNQSKIYVNAACLKRMPDVDYVQILVNADEKKLVIRPTDEDAKDAFLWCSSKTVVRRPKQITCRVFFAKIVNLMSWNADYRYGSVLRTEIGHQYAFRGYAFSGYPRGT